MIKPDEHALRRQVVSTLTDVVDRESPQLPTQGLRGAYFANYWGSLGRAGVRLAAGGQDRELDGLLIDTFARLLDVRAERLGHGDLRLPVWGAPGVDATEAASYDALTTAHILLPVLEMLAEHAARRGRRRPRTETAGFLEAAIESIAVFDADLRPGTKRGVVLNARSGDKPLPFHAANMYGAVVAHAAALTGDPALMERARGLATTFRDALTAEPNGTFSWPASITTSRPEATWTAASSVQLPVALFDAERHPGSRAGTFSRDDMAAFGDTFLRNVVQRGELTRSVAHDDRAPITPADVADVRRLGQIGGWAALAPYRPAVALALRRQVVDRPDLFAKGWASSRQLTMAASMTVDPAAWRTATKRTRRRVDQSTLEQPEIDRRDLGFRQRRRMGSEDIDSLFRLLDTADEVIPVGEAQRRFETLEGRVIALRHDVDHDLSNALRFGELEAARGFASTFYMLHTDWYFRTEPGGPPTGFLLDACDHLVSLGHEIALHNNAIAAALTWGEEPLAILDRDLGFLRSAGHDVLGTVAHGDPLCHEFRFNNGEVFMECERPRLGEPNRLIYDAGPPPRQARLTPVSMASLGLEYEANYIGHRWYLSDTGGYWSRPIAEAQADLQARTGLLQVLVHPVWWALDGGPHTPKAMPATRR